MTQPREWVQPQQPSPADASTSHASPVTAAAAKTGCPQLLIPVMALQREQHEELQLPPMPGTEWEEGVPLVEFQALLQRLLPWPFV